LKRQLAIWASRKVPAQIDPAEYDDAREDKILAELGAAGHFARST
jgi:hypothetical protein